MIPPRLFLFFLLMPVLFSCHTPRQAGNTAPGTGTEPEREYRSSEKRTNDIVHTRLEIRPDWEKQYLYGKALLTVQPYFYSADSLILDAKGFDLRNVALIPDSGSHNPEQALTYVYDSLRLHIKLDKTYYAGQQYNILIEYVARPNELKVKGSEAIEDAKGLYFINPDGKENDKPRQIWTQGETQSNSCWFPTIDSPNERMTQEIYLTVDTQYVTLSNGLLEYSLLNNDGTRTDYWKQNLPAAPYLTMFAVGKFSVIKDKWKDLEVSYYVEPGYAPYAKSIFGHTPEMLEFFSGRLGVNYPWEKFSQIVVRDYVSGAMENTSAVIHGEFLQRTNRELLDETNEDVVSHELFHHWFGDLVTCESWSNLTLNESFATYGEYLWNEYKYGREEADYAANGDLSSYLYSSKTNEKLVRFYYNDREDLFDVISYQKGGRILHMLRKYVGDSAFFASLRLYLESNKFNTAEAHQLRLAFEQVTGEDLNWFFNQWFYGSGHPELVISYNYSASLKKEFLVIRQQQEPLFRLPMAVDIYSNGKPVRHYITVAHRTDTFSFDLSARPDLVNADAEKMLLCKKTENKTPEEWAYQYQHAPLYLDRYEALDQLSPAPIYHYNRKTSEFTALPNTSGNDSLTEDIIAKALVDPFWNIRRKALRSINVKTAGSQGVKEKIISLAASDPKASVRSEAILVLAKYFGGDSSLATLYKNAINDSSYHVMASALHALFLANPSMAFQMARSIENEKQLNVVKAIAEVYAREGTEEQFVFFEKNFQRLKLSQQQDLLHSYVPFLLKCLPETTIKGISPIENMIARGKRPEIKEDGIRALYYLKNMFVKKIKDGGDRKKNEIASEKEQEGARKTLEAINATIARLRKAEQDPVVLMLYNSLEKAR